MSSEKKRARGASFASDHSHHSGASVDYHRHASQSKQKKPPLPPLAPFVNLPMYGEHKRAVSSVKLAPSRLTQKNGPAAICASASADGSVKIWDLLSSSSSGSGGSSYNASPAYGTPGSSTHTEPPTATGNSNNKDTNTTKNNNKYLLTPISTLVGHSRGINDVAWSPDAPMVATASDDKTLRLWDATTGDALVEFRGHDNFVFCTEIYQNLLASGSFDETVKLWDIRCGECISTVPVHSDPVTAVSFNRDGTCLVSASHDGLIRIWDVQTSECLKTIYASGNPPVSHVTYSPNGKYVLAGTLDSKLRLWNVGQRGSNKCTKTYAAPSSLGHVNQKYCIVSDFMVSRPDRQCIVTGSEAGKILLYDINSRKIHQVLEGVHTDAVLAVDAHDRHELIASGGMTKDKTVQFWAPENSDLTAAAHEVAAAAMTTEADDGKRTKLS